jgi:hypothetical protein
MSVPPPEPPACRLEPPCAGRLVLTWWLILVLLFPVVWLVTLLRETARVMSQKKPHIWRARDASIALLQSANSRSLRWLSNAAGWDNESQ